MTTDPIALACLLVLVAAGPLVLPDFYITLLDYIGLYSIVTLALVLLTGVAGLTSFGHAAFVGVGAYTSAVLTPPTVCRHGCPYRSRLGSRLFAP